MLHGRSAASPSSLEMNVDDLIEILFAHVVQQLVAQDACIVDEHVKLAECRDHGGN